METTLAIVPDASQINPARAFIASLAEGSRRSAIGSLAKVAAMNGCEWDGMPWAQLRVQHVAAIRAKLIEDGCAPDYTNKILSAVKSTLRQAWLLQQVSREDYEQVRSVKGAKGKRLPSGRALSVKELKRLHQAVEDGASSELARLRDHALLSVWYVAFPRRSEIVAMDISDFNPGEGSIVIRHGKGDKERKVFVDAALPYLAAWLEVRGPETGPLFCPVDRWGHLSMRRMIPHAVYLLLSRLAERAGIEHFTAHDGRRTAITRLEAAGVPLSVIARMAGHESLTTTARYLRHEEVLQRDAARGLGV